VLVVRGYGMPKKQNPRSFGAASQLEMLELKLEGNSRSAALESPNCDTNISNVLYIYNQYMKNIYIFGCPLQVFSSYSILSLWWSDKHILAWDWNQQSADHCFIFPSTIPHFSSSNLWYFFHFFSGRFSHPQLLFPKCCHYSLPHNHPQSPISRGFIQQTGILDPEAIYWCVLRLTSLRPSSASLWWDQQSSGYILYDVYLDIWCGYTFYFFPRMMI
jgi:hypothetical protein